MQFALRWHQDKPIGRVINGAQCDHTRRQGAPRTVRLRLKGREQDGCTCGPTFAHALGYALARGIVEKRKVRLVAPWVHIHEVQKISALVCER